MCRTFWVYASPSRSDNRWCPAFNRFGFTIKNGLIQAKITECRGMEKIEYRADKNKEKIDVARGEKIEIYFSWLGKEWKTTEEERGTADTASHSSGATRTRGLLIYTHTHARACTLEKEPAFRHKCWYIYICACCYTYIKVCSRRGGWRMEVEGW